MPVEHFCLSCSKTFATLSGARSHARAKRHSPNPFVCEECELSFSSSMALESHNNSPRHAVDYDSDDDYPSDAFLDGRDESEESSSNSEGEPVCDGCNRQFTDMIALNQHLANSSKHNWCFECARDFTSYTALQSHINSLAHRERSLECPFCTAKFKAPSGVVLHIESGCHKITRHHVTAAVQKMKIVPDITIKRIMGPVQPPMTVRTFIATEASFNGSSYDCYLCQRIFRTLSGLNAHLNSPAHDDDEFKCPKCKTELKLISGFVQHLESGVCKLAKMTKINDYFDDLTGQFSRLLKM